METASPRTHKPQIVNESLGIVIPGPDFLTFKSEDSITMINMKYKLKIRSTTAAPYRLGTYCKALTCLKVPTSMTLFSNQEKILLYIVGLKAGESFDTSMSTCDGVGI